jgi:hypothetical protein
VIARLALVTGLALLSPLVGEYLISSVSMADLLALPVLVPMYGGGALLVREIARNLGRGWSTMALLGLAYGTIQAGLVDMSMFDPQYGGLDLAITRVPGIDVSVYYGLAFVVGHAVWGIGLPIAIVEAFAGARRRTPWLGQVGLVCAALAYVGGCLLVGTDRRGAGGFQASVVQLVLAGLLAIAVVAAAVRSPGRPGLLAARLPTARLPIMHLSIARLSEVRLPGARWAAPAPALVAGGSFAATSAFTLAPPSWAGVVLAVTVLAGSWALLSWARTSRGWVGQHDAAAAGGALLTYVWSGYVVANLLGHTGLGELAALALLDGLLLALAAQAVRAAGGHPATWHPSRRPPTERAQRSSASSE